MANAANNPGALPPGQSGPEDSYNPPPSRPLQIFLFCAFLVTVAAYVAGHRADLASEQLAARLRDAKLDRAAVDNGRYRAYIKLGSQAEARQDFGAAVSNYQSALLLQNTGEAHYDLGNALLHQSRTNEALKEFQAALALDPKLNMPAPLAGKP
jgi:tetratricopeptide (TPR) repeat protein